MNYRHSFHAGNHTEVFKHAALTLVLEHLLQKPQPFAVVDTHGGIGIYDLTSEEAVRTNEKAAGVEKIFGKSLSSAPVYVEALQALNGPNLKVYPGSPELIRYVLRESDRLVVCELHAEDGSRLKKRFRKDRRISVHLRDGYEGIGALLPPRERRGLVFIDPPYERKDETERVRSALQTGFKKWSTGIYAVWYPIKDALIGDEIASAATAASFTNVLRAEFCPYQRDGVALAGSGIVICNPPWKVDDRLRHLCEDLMLFLGERGSSWSVKSVNST